MIGFQPDAPNNQLVIDPTLPDWLPEFTLRDLRVGRDTFDIRFARDGTETVHDVLRGDPSRVVRRPMTVWLPA